eukprot:TRINITY_DN15366_c1_g1_i1.p1 TRINITY_DN15366_c1_g1~~TRINITY_DN15366_c1_g1_i1.p1  ORF type:complete len:1530 (-),score=419.39 TRINITY_DN15366_c1_g1_i1:49-4638(-)
MELRRDEAASAEIASARVYAPALERRGLLVAVLVAAYAVASFHCWNTSGESRAWALEKIRKRNRENFANKTDPKTVLPDDPLPMQWAPASWAGVLMGTVVSLHVFFHLLCYWRPSFKAKALFKPAKRVRHGHRVLATPPEHRGSAGLVEVRMSDLTGHCGFEFQRQRYEVRTEDDNEDEEADLIRKVRCPINKPIVEYVRSKGLREDDVEMLTEQYGKNLLTVPVPGFLTLYKEQILSPLVVFQLFLSILWAMDDYISYTLMQISFILMFESSTVFQRQRTMKMLNGMTVKPFDVKVYREGEWLEVSTCDLLPGDLMQLVVAQPEPTAPDAAAAAVADANGDADKEETSGEAASAPQAPAAPAASAADPNAGICVVPCDCLVLRGEAIVNEASLTGESVPQMKEALILENEGRKLDMEGSDVIHLLSSGTSPMSAKAGEPVKSGPAALLPETPDGGCLCYVLRTSFNSSQGKLLQMIEFSTDRRAVKADEREMSIALLILLGFAILASGYVMKKGLEKGDKTLYELVLKCVIIISSVVPRSLPMTMAVAVNTALMTLMRAGVFCTEPFRVPFAGKLTHCLFDKTGTITTDTLSLEGIVNATTDAPSSEAKTELEPVRAASLQASMVLGACHSIVEVSGRGLVGDPIELSALRSVGWSFDGTTATARPCEAEARQRAVAAAKAELKKIEDRFALMATGGPFGPQEPTEADRKEKSEKEALVQGAEEALKESEEQDAKHPLESVQILQRYRFLSKLQRSCTVVRVAMRDEGAALRSGRYALVKGSPEAIEKLLAEGAAPSWYQTRYRDLAEEGKRILALALKELPEGPDDEVPTREESESQLRFVGFIAFSCKVRGDSALVINSLRESAHTVSLITGDSPLTALHVARETGFCAKKSTAYVLQVGEAGDVSWAVATGDRRGETKPFSAAGLRALVETDGADLMLTEAGLRAGAESDPALWQHLEHIRVFARMTPQGKADVIRALQKCDAKVLMCGDGGNDMGALKQADVGLALFSGYGNVNAGGESGGSENADGEAAGDSAAADALVPTAGSAEDRLNQEQKDLQKRGQELQKEKQRLLKQKQAELQLKQKVWLEEEVARREAAGLPTGVMGQAAALKVVMSRFTAELLAERKELDRKFGNAYEKKKVDPLKQLLGEFEEGAEGGGAGGAAAAAGGMPMVRPGDASLAAAFTSRVPSIRSTVDLIRQGRCALLSALQQQQIVMLHCLINAYVLSALSLEGSKSSERQMMASSWLLSTASIAFSYARPCDKMHPVRPLRSLFHPAVFVSLFGQAAIHLGCLVFATSMAREAMDPNSEVRKDGLNVGPSLDEVSEFWKKQRLIRRGLMEKEEIADEDLGIVEVAMKQWESPFLPNLMNTVVFLVETSQTVAVLAVNYKGQPWMKGLVENRPLFLSVFILVGAMAMCAWEVVPQANALVHLTPFPGDVFRWKIMALVLISIFGTFVWDRVCVWFFAPSIFKAMLDSAKKTTLRGDVFPVFWDCGKIIFGFCLFSLGLPGWIALFFWWKNRKKEE